MSADAGLHVPVKPLVDVTGNVGTIPPSQIVSDVPKLKVGVILGFTVTVNVAGVAHKPASGVNVYTPEAWSLTTAGFHTPVMPSVDAAGNAGTAALPQMVSDVPKLNVGVIFGLTVTVNVAGVAHTPAAGVNVYTSEAWSLTTAGLHEPVILFEDDVGTTGPVPPAQMVNSVPKLNVGVMLGFTVMVNVVGVAHSPASGVNVYTPEFWLSADEGFHVPAIPFDDVVGSDGTTPFAQMVNDVPKLNVGVIFGLTVTVNVAAVAHSPASGVNVYTPEFWLSTDEGLHTPVIPSNDAAGNNGTVPLPQIVSEVPKLNVGVMFGFTVTVNVAGVAHMPASGVNVYVPEFWLSTVAGLHEPLMPFKEVPGNEGTVSPVQTVSDTPKLKVGVMFGVTVTVKVAGVAHKPAAGVNVYTPEAWLSTTAGLHVPASPLADVAGKAGTAPPAQIASAVPKLKVGVVLGITVTFIKPGSPH